MKTPVTVSMEQVQAYSAVMHGINNRPVQDINAHPVLR
jgi:carbonic anhydrase